jgi:hypothetical protein
VTSSLVRLYGIRHILASVLAPLALAGCTGDEPIPSNPAVVEYQLLEPLENAGAAAVKGNQIMVAGGDTTDDRGSNVRTANAEVLVGGHPQFIVDLPEKLGGLALVNTESSLGVDRPVILIGGTDGQAQSGTLIYTRGSSDYNIAKDRWIPGPDLREARAFFWYAKIGDVIYVGGGVGRGGRPLASVESLSLSHLKAGWQLVASMPDGPRIYSEAVAQGDLVLVTGGLRQDTPEPALASTILLDTRKGLWRRGPNPDRATAFAAFATSDTGKGVIGGGSTGSESSSSHQDVILRADATGGVRPTGKKLTHERVESAAVFIRDGSAVWICFVGGLTRNGLSRSVECLSTEDLG